MPSQPVLKFYISSTFLDLEEERSAIHDGLVLFKNLPVETVVASPNPVLAECLKDVDECDVYLLIIGSRYGTSVADEEGVCRSITHHEYCRALKKNKPILAFLLEYSTAASNLQEAVSQKSDEESDSKLQRFKGEVCNLDCTPSYVKRKVDLGWKVSAAVQNYVNRFVVNRDGIAPTPSSGERRSAPLFSGGTLNLMIQLRERGTAYELTPETFYTTHIGDSEPLVAEGLHPETVTADKLLTLLEDWKALAEEALPQEVVPCVDDVVVEIFLPAEVLASSLSSPGTVHPIRRSLASIAGELFVIRALSRAEARPLFRNNLRRQWQRAYDEEHGLLRCTKWPPGSPAGIDTTDMQRFSARLRSEQTATGLVCLEDFPPDPQTTGELLKEILRSPLPLVLLWHGEVGDVSKRWDQSLQLLDRQLSEPQDHHPEAEESLFDFVSVRPGGWSSLGAARRRQRLFGDGAGWVEDAMLLVDCPDRWPQKMPAVRSRSEDRLQLRVRAST